MCIKKSIPVIIVLILFSCFIVGFLNFGTIKEINKNIYLQQENLIAVQAFNKKILLLSRRLIIILKILKIKF
jgi:hypothetical protein